MFLTRLDGSEQTAPSQSSGRKKHVDEAQNYIAPAALLSILPQAISALRAYITIGGIGKELFSHPAVSALGCDLIISVVSFSVWIGTQSGISSAAKTSKKGS